MIGKYERWEATPYIVAAKKLAGAYEVSLDYLVGEGQHATYDMEMVKRLDQIEELPELVQPHSTGMEEWVSLPLLEKVRAL